MERLYGGYECGVCRLPSGLGWVYRCTQDDEEALSAMLEPGKDAVDAEKKGGLRTLSRMREEAWNDEREGVDERLETRTTRLSLWMEKAVTEGLYTPAQIILLRAQKQK
ncbi:MAG: hypothetical protein Q9217_003315, partial [Psora testacea]